MILLNGKLGFPGGADGKETAYNAKKPKQNIGGGVCVCMCNIYIYN